MIGIDYFEDGVEKNIREYSENWIKRHYRVKMIDLSHKNVRFDIKTRWIPMTDFCSLRQKSLPNNTFGCLLLKKMQNRSIMSMFKNWLDLMLFSMQKGP